VLEYVFDTCRGPLTPPNDLGLVAVVDGRKPTSHHIELGLHA
jgi:hypothetical protein